MHWSKSTSAIIDAVGEVWVLLFIAYFVLSIGNGIVQDLRRKELWDTQAFVVLGILYYAWVIPIGIPIVILYWIFKWGMTALVIALATPIISARWLYHKILAALRRRTA